MEWWLVVAGGLCLSLFVTAVSIYFPSTIMPGLERQVIPSLVIFALLVGSLILLRPEVGVLLIIAMTLLRPEIVQGMGIVTILMSALSGILLATIAIRNQLWFLRVRQVQIFFLIGSLVVINWLFVGRMEPPGYLSQADLTIRVLQRSVIQLALLIFFVSFIRTSRQLMMVTALFLFALFLTVPGAISHSMRGVEAAAGGVDILRAAATSGIEAAENANRLAFICLMGISLIWFWLLECRSKLLRIFAGVAIFILVLIVLLSGSRGGLLNLGIAALLILGQSGLRRGQIVAVILLFVFFISVGFLFVPEQISQRLVSFALTSESVKVESSTLSLQRRYLMVQLGLKMFAENPFFGVGIGNVRWMNALDPASGGIPMSLHNSYLLTLAEGGMILLGAYLLLFGVTLRDLGKALKMSSLAPQLRLRWLVLATRTNLILLLVFSLFAETWKEFYYLLILGTAAVLSQLYRKVAEQSCIQSRSST
ncbi:MAG: O-antigen ligase family protein [Deltaproteobacteria bacterium]|nr:O-antigen ligase family protein [Deltaproteobacteria bacterium]